MKNLLNKHWEKLALGVSGALVLAYVVFGIVTAQPDTIHGDARAVIREVGELHGKGDQQAPPPVAARRRIEDAFGPSVAAGAADEWVYYKKAAVTVKMNEVAEAGVVREILFKAPELVSAAADVGAVTLSWVDAAGNTVKTVGYVVYRAKRGDKEFARINAEPLTEKSTVDGSVQPKTEYAYAVAALTDDAEAVTRLGLARKGDAAEGPRSAAKVVTTLGVIGVTLRIVSEQPPANAGDEPLRIARVTVRKFLDGGWEQKDYSVRKGEKIGKLEVISKGGRPVKVDFSTQYEVVDIARAEVVTRVPRIEKKFNDKGEVVDQKTVYDERKSLAWELTYKDEEKKTQRVRQEEGRAPVKPAAPGAPGTAPGAAPAPGGGKK